MKLSMFKKNLVALLLSTCPSTVFAQATDVDMGEEIVVTGQRPRGSIVGDTPPEVTFTAGDIRAFAATNLSDLLSQLAPQTGGGTPVVLLNGKRISGMSEIRDIPQEAIVRVEVFPPEVALRYGYRATDRVVNIILRSRFSAVQSELTGSTTTEGGRDTGRVQLGILRIRDNGRTSLDGQYQRQSALEESERDIPLETTPDARDFRSLLGRLETMSLNGTVSRPLSDTISLTFNARGELNDGRSGLGLEGARPLIRDTLDKAVHTGVTANGKLGGWQWTFTSNVDVARSRSLTDRAGQTARDFATSLSKSADASMLLNGPLFRLPAGEASATVALSGDAERLRSSSIRAATSLASELDRETGSGRLSVDLPIANANKAVLSPLGKLSLNANAAFDRVSGLGTLQEWGYGMAWAPFKGLDLSANVTHEEDAPTIQQLGNPVLSTPNVRAFDYVRGETATITRVDGGNAGLTADDARTIKLGMTLRPIKDTDLSIVGTYTDTRTDNAIFSFPTATAALESAFPSRFMRDATGRLVAIDARPLNIAETRHQDFRWGINFSKRLGPAPTRNPLDGLRGPGGGGGTPGGEPRRDGPGAGPGGGGPRGFGGGGFGGAPRVQFALYHTWTLREDILLAPGTSRLDLLDGDAIANSGGASRHKIEAQGGFTKSGLGFRLSANWQSGTEVVTPTSTLRFGSLATVDLRLFANLGSMPKLVEKHDWLRGTQIFLGINNLFDSKQRVRDATGTTPFTYLPDRLDPQGRTIRLTIRKLFSSFRPGQRPQ